ncbi:dihydropyrimidine dehydrogenase [Pelomyxa schiedti]|nr:dihydropyrimidine dehydrogenase [Pelomyxa schiedti]
MSAHRGDLWTDDIERLAQHPCVKTHVAVRPTVVSDESLVSAWKSRVGKIPSSKIPSDEEMTRAMEARAAEATRTGTCSAWPRTSRNASLQGGSPTPTVEAVHSIKGDFQPLRKVLSEEEALSESARCLKCADAPCSKGCPTGVDIKGFMHSISKEDYYHAARIILSDNPLGLTCGLLCPAEHTCRGCCNLRDRLGGSIEISRLQQFACDVYRKMELTQIRDPSLPSTLAPSYQTKIALIGAGPASLSCATYLARMGYSDITIFEKAIRPGGQPNLTIPEFRIPSYVTDFEAKLVTELGVKMEFGQVLGTSFTLESLKAKGFGTLFVGVGLPNPFTLPIFTEPANNLVTSTAFLSDVAAATRPPNTGKLPIMSGHVLVLGGGDVAYDVANTCFRCGAARVTLAFREDIPHKPCSDSEFVHGVAQHHVELMSNMVPVKVLREGPIVTGVVFEARDWIQKDGLFAQSGQTLTVSCDFVIVAFGCTPPASSILGPLSVLPQGFIKIDPTTNATSVEGIFAGGDCVGSVSVVQAVNDGKNAAWSMHKYIQGLSNVVVPAVPRLPMMFTNIDTVDISHTICGIRFPNPFGLSSATPTGSIAQIRRAFEMGWGFAVTKTAVPIPATNVSPRIIRSRTSRLSGPNQAGFQNIELITEKTLGYWVEGVKLLKREFPEQVVIFSIMAPAEKEAWEQIAIEASTSNPDALELNLSCPHVGRKGYGMLAGQSPDMVQQITSWVRAVVPTKIPVFVKLTPNITNIVDIAAAAKAGGANGVTAINTVRGLSVVQPNGIPWPAVGTAQNTAYGGMSGNMIRPMALQAISSITKALPGFAILGTGGVDSAESALQMFHAGAQAIQITSAIQNQEYTIIDELKGGLKAALFMKNQPRFAAWKGQVPPSDFVPSREATPVNPPVSLESQIGITVPHITVVPQLDVKAQVRAVIDYSNCLGCGKCYMSCNDTGYVAIEFDKDLHFPLVTESCMGCGLCQSVCPAQCITYELKTTPHHVCRGIPDPSLELPFDP